MIKSESFRLISRGIDEIAVSPIDPDNQINLLNEGDENTNLITDNSDAFNSDKLCFIKINKY